MDRKKLLAWDPGSSFSIGPNYKSYFDLISLSITLVGSLPVSDVIIFQELCDASH